MSPAVSFERVDFPPRNFAPNEHRGFYRVRFAWPFEWQLHDRDQYLEIRLIADPKPYVIWWADVSAYREAWGALEFDLYEDGDIGRAFQAQQSDPLRATSLLIGFRGNGQPVWGNIQAILEGKSFGSSEKIIRLGSHLRRIALRFVPA